MDRQDSNISQMTDMRENTKKLGKASNGMGLIIIAVAILGIAFAVLRYSVTIFESKGPKLAIEETMDSFETDVLGQLKSSMMVEGADTVYNVYEYIDNKYLSSWRDSTKYTIGNYSIKDGKAIVPIEITYLDATKIAEKAMEKLETEYKSKSSDGLFYVSIEGLAKESFDWAASTYQPEEKTNVMYLECSKQEDKPWSVEIYAESEEDYIKTTEIACNGTFQYTIDLLNF